MEENEEKIIRRRSLAWVRGKPKALANQASDEKNCQEEEKGPEQERSSFPPKGGTPPETSSKSLEELELSESLSEWKVLLTKEQQSKMLDSLSKLEQVIFEGLTSKKEINRETFNNHFRLLTSEIARLSIRIGELALYGEDSIMSCEWAQLKVHFIKKGLQFLAGAGTAIISEELLSQVKSKISLIANCIGDLFSREIENPAEQRKKKYSSADNYNEQMHTQLKKKKGTPSDGLKKILGSIIGQKKKKSEEEEETGIETNVASLFAPYEWNTLSPKVHLQSLAATLDGICSIVSGKNVLLKESQSFNLSGFHKNLKRKLDLFEKSMHQMDKVKEEKQRFTTQMNELLDLIKNVSFKPEDWEIKFEIISLTYSVKESCWWFQNSIENAVKLKVNFDVEVSSKAEDKMFVEQVISEYLSEVKKFLTFLYFFYQRVFLKKETSSGRGGHRRKDKSL